MFGGDFYFPKLKKSPLKKNIILTPAEDKEQKICHPIWESDELCHKTLIASMFTSNIAFVNKTISFGINFMNSPDWLIHRCICCIPDGYDDVENGDYISQDRPARGTRPIFECYWNGRLIPYTTIEEWVFNFCRNLFFLLWERLLHSQFTTRRVISPHHNTHSLLGSTLSEKKK